MKNRLALLACVLLAFQLGACTSNDSKEDESASEESLSSDESLEEVDGLDAEGGEEIAEGEAAPEGELEDGFTEDALTDAPAEGSDLGGDVSVAETTPEPIPDTGGEALPSTEDGFTDTLPPADNFADSAPPSDTGDVAAVQETPPPSDTSYTPPSSSNSEAFDSGNKPSFPVSSLKKIEATPFERDGVLLNGVYFARPGDSFSKISKTIYGGSQKTKELKNVNPGVMPRVGDAIYYNSPARPTDANVMKNYYEDQGVQAKVYIANDGDDLKKVSRDLLGFPEAWKEVWASNSVDSKGKLAAGTEIRYYGEGSSGGGETAPADQTLAQADVPSAPAPDMGMPPMDNSMPPAPEMGMPPADASMPPAPDMGMPPDQMADMPPPPPEMGLPPDDGMGGDSMAGMNAPPPPPPDMAPPPPPPPPPSEVPQMAQKAEVSADGSDNDVMMALGAAGGIAAILALLMVMRKRRQQREMAAAFGDTQVGT